MTMMSIFRTIERITQTNSHKDITKKMGTKSTVKIYLLLEVTKNYLRVYCNYE